VALPPGQRAVDGFPRFGTHLHNPPPPIPSAPAIEVVGAITNRVSVPLTALAGMPRREQSADFHCVAGWSASGLRWEGVPFRHFYEAIVAPLLDPAAAVTHLSFGGLDGYRFVADIRDALADDVLLAERLDGAPLSPDHGAPVRLLSPSQYGFHSVKHLSRIEVHTRDPGKSFGAASRLAKALMIPPLFSLHPRSRVWPEERNAVLPNWAVRPINRALIPPLMWLCRRGSRS
jgi:DMSO/TMAO reductase YedYZ molybdopterin-dependent catalytic subunit